MKFSYDKRFGIGAGNVRNTFYYSFYRDCPKKGYAFNRNMPGYEDDLRNRWRKIKL